MKQIYHSFKFLLLNPTFHPETAGCKNELAFSVFICCSLSHKMKNLSRVC